MSVIYYNESAETIAAFRNAAPKIVGVSVAKFPIYEPAPIPQGEWPAWAKAVQLLSEDEDSGVGDTIARLLGKYGRAYKKSLLIIGVPCGCDERQAEYNAKYHYEKGFTSGENPRE